MLDNLLNLVKENAGNDIINNKAIPNELNEKAIQTTTDSIFESLQKQVSGGNISQITELLRGNNQSESTPIFDGINSDVVSNLTSKLGIDSNAAKALASSLIPMVMSKLANKTNDPSDSSFDLQGIIGSLSGKNDLVGGIADVVGGSTKGNTGDILNSVKGIFGN